jgi:hypothetical protein
MTLQLYLYPLSPNITAQLGCFTFEKSISSNLADCFVVACNSGVVPSADFAVGGSNAATKLSQVGLKSAKTASRFGYIKTTGFCYFCQIFASGVSAKLAMVCNLVL